MKFNSIKNNIDFVKAYKNGKRFVSHIVVLYKIKNKEGEKRIGITVSKKVGNAVVRNRVKRLIREALYLSYFELEEGYDYVFVARVSASNVDYKDFTKNMSYLVNLTKKKSKV